MSYWEAFLAALTVEHFMSGVIGGAAGALFMFGLAWFRDRSLTRHKEELGRESARLTNQMTQASNETLERLRRDLGLTTEAFKSDLKKREWLFDKELEAARAFVDMKSHEIGSFDDPTWSIVDAAREMTGSRLRPLENALKSFRQKFGLVLPLSLRQDLNESILTASLTIANSTVNMPPDDWRAESAAETVLRQVVSFEEKLLLMIRE